jgi:cysteinyl-tRNA synthetase
LIQADAVSAATLSLLQQKFKAYLEDVFGLQNSAANNEVLSGVMDLLIEIRKESKAKRDFATSDKIRNQLATIGINLKDEKGGEMSWDIA